MKLSGLKEEGKIYRKIGIHSALSVWQQQQQQQQQQKKKTPSVDSQVHV